MLLKSFSVGKVAIAFLAMRHGEMKFRTLANLEASQRISRKIISKEKTLLVYMHTCSEVEAYSKVTADLLICPQGRVLTVSVESFLRLYERHTTEPGQSDKCRRVETNNDIA